MSHDTKPRPVPSVGRVVHYLAHGSADQTTYAAGVPRAAIVTQVLHPGDPESAVGLCVLSPSGIFFNEQTPFGTAPGCWTWPEYVPPAVGLALPREATEDEDGARPPGPPDVPRVPNHHPFA